MNSVCFLGEGVDRPDISWTLSKISSAINRALARGFEVFAVSTNEPACPMIARQLHLVRLRHSMNLTLVTNTPECSLAYLAEGYALDRVICPNDPDWCSEDVQQASRWMAELSDVIVFVGCPGEWVMKLKKPVFQIDPKGRLTKWYTVNS